MTLQSNQCNLRGMSAAALVGKNEESNSWGGYFIVNGNEKLIRYRESPAIPYFWISNRRLTRTFVLLVILPRRNHAVSLIRPSFEKVSLRSSKMCILVLQLTRR